LGMGIQICSNKGAGPITDNIRKILISLQTSDDEQLVRMHCYLILNVLGERRFKFVKMNSLGASTLHNDI